MGDSGLISFFYLSSGNMTNVHLEREATLAVLTFLSNWAEYECFSDRTRCVQEDGALKGDGSEGETNMMKESSKSVCLLFLASLKKGESNYSCTDATDQSFCMSGLTFAFK